MKMNQRSNHHPLVPRHWLFVISGVLWCAVGALMCLRAYFWTDHTSLEHLFVFEIIGLAAAMLGFRFGLSKITQRNINRILALPERSSVFSFIGSKGYIIMMGMICLGIFLRYSSIPKEYLAIPYNAMGGSLLFGSVNFLLVFKNHHQQK